jgi:hypothetical protein
MKRALVSPCAKLAASLVLVTILFSLHQICPTDLGAGISKQSCQKFQKGMCYVAWEKDKYLSPYSDKSLESLVSIGTDWVSIVTTWYQKNAQSTSISPTENTPTDESLVHAIQKAHGLGLKVMLKPHVDLAETSDGLWRGDIFFYKDEEWDAWFREYKKFIVHYAALAERSGVDILCIGTELAGTSERLAQWKEIVQTVRKVYHGPLTYAANWDEFERVSFWTELDYAGIDAYFPLSQKENPAFEELKAACDQWIKKVESWALPLGKPIIFTEVGYSSTPCAATKPWEEKTPGGANVHIQANCYRALLESIWGKEWLAGIYWWRWSTHPDAGGPNNKGYTPQNKPALQVLAEWYKR